MVVVKTTGEQSGELDGYVPELHFDPDANQIDSEKEALQKTL